jgi:hypothetical protein
MGRAQHDAKNFFPVDLPKPTVGGAAQPPWTLVIIDDTLGLLKFSLQLHAFLQSHVTTDTSFNDLWFQASSLARANICC